MLIMRSGVSLTDGWVTYKNLSLGGKQQLQTVNYTICKRLIISVCKLLHILKYTVYAINLRTITPIVFRHHKFNQTLVLHTTQVCMNFLPFLNNKTLTLLVGVASLPYKNVTKASKDHTVAFYNSLSSLMWGFSVSFKATPEAIPFHWWNLQTRKEQLLLPWVVLTMEPCCLYSILVRGNHTPLGKDSCFNFTTTCTWSEEWNHSR